MQVKAKSPGIYGKRRRTGDTFDIASGEALGSWMVALNAGLGTEAEASAKPPVARKAKAARKAKNPAKAETKAKAESATKAETSEKAKPRKQA